MQAAVDKCNDQQLTMTRYDTMITCFIRVYAFSPSLSLFLPYTPPSENMISSLQFGIFVNIFRLKTFYTSLSEGLLATFIRQIVCLFDDGRIQCH